MPPSVAIVHSPGSFHPLEVFQHVAGQAELIWALAGEAGEPGMARLLPKLGRVLDISGLGPDQVADALAPLAPAGVVTFLDRHLCLVAEVAARLGLPYHDPEVAARLVDKRRQRRALAAAGVPGPDFWPIADGATREEVAALAALVAYPAVLKPALGSDSRGVALVTGAAELVEAAGDGRGYLVESVLAPAGGTPAWRSADLRVESVASPAGLDHLVVRGVFPVTEPFRLTGTFLPAELGPDDEGRVLATVGAALEALGITTGVVDTELRMTPAGPAVIEVNGGVAGTVPFLLADVSEVDLFQLACAVAAGAAPAHRGPVACREVAFSWRLHPPVGASRLVSLEGVEELKAQVPEVATVSVRLRPGAEVDWRQGTSSVVAIVQWRAAGHAELERALAQVRRLLRAGFE